MLKFLSRLWIIGLFICGLAMPVWAQGNEMSLDDAIRGYEAATHQTFQGVPDDWSTHHVVFSRPEPGSETEYRVQQDPRYWLQQIKEKMPAAADAATSDVGLGPEIPLKKKPVNKKSKAKINTDWSEDMGSGAKVGSGQYPAKFSLSPNSTPNCTTDYVVYNTGLAGATSTTAAGTGTFANNTSVAGNTVVINGVTLTATGVGTDVLGGQPANGSTTIIDGVTYTWEGTCSVANCVVSTSTPATNASNLVKAITNTCGSVSYCIVSGANPGATAVISISSTTTVVVTNTTVGAISWSLTGTNHQTLAPASSISAASTSGLNFALSTNTTTAASSLTTAINNNTGTDDVTATFSGAVVTVNAAIVGSAGNLITTTDTMVGFSWAGGTLAGGADGQATILAFNNLYPGASPGCGTSGVPAIYWAYNTGSGSTVATAPLLSPDGSQIAFIQSSSGGVASLVLLKWNQTTTGRILTGSLATSSPEVTLTSGTFTQADVGAQISGTGVPAGDTIANVLSGTTANLAAAPAAAYAAEPLTITADAVDAPGVPPLALTASAYRSCTAPCMYTIAFRDGHNDTNSFPFYDYSGGDLIFAGDDSGYLHEFTGVFKGTPAEAASPFPVEVTTSGLALSTPVYDSNTGLAFVGEAHTSGSTTDGKFHSVCATSTCGTVGTVAHSGPTAGTDHALCHGVGFTEGPLLDPAAGTHGTAYIGCDHDVGGDTCGNGNNACLRQFPEESISGSVGTAVAMGAQADAEMYAGAFDYTYLTSSAPTGSLYFCGNPAGEATLYRIPIISNVMQTPVVVNRLSTTTSSAGTECSPVTEFHNASTDWLFVSEPNAPALDTGTCTGTGCVYSFNISKTPVATATATPTAAMPSASGASGIIVDNGANSTGSSNVYFSTLGDETCTTSGGTGGCAIQAAQSNLSD